MKYIDQFYGLLDLTIKSQASDLHLSAGHSPTIRIDGSLVPIIKEKILTQTREDLENITKKVL